LDVVFCFTEIPASDWSVMRGRLVGGGVHLWQTAGVLHRKGGAPAIRGVCASYYYNSGLCVCVYVWRCCMYDWLSLYHSVIKSQATTKDKHFC